MFVWLVSYPKSGNTWMRAMLTNYRQDAHAPPNLTEPLIADSTHLVRHDFDEYMGLASSELSSAELEDMRPKYHAMIMKKFNGTAFAKMHEAYVGPSDVPIIPASSGGQAIYLLRNPLDIVASYAHHDGTSTDCIIDRMANPASRVHYSDANFSEHLGTWSEHVIGWTEQSALKVLVVRYEDMLLDPAVELSRVINFSGLQLDEDRLQRAIKNASFPALQEQERTIGYVEGFAGEAPFFRQGQAEGWRTELTKTQADRIRADHGLVMEKFGYA